MAKHEFGIMEIDPISGKRYDEYEPEKYNCISVDDDYIEDIQAQLCVFASCCHTVDIPMKGLNYCGVTLIPPTSLDAFADVINSIPELAELKELLMNAKKRNKYIIHYGL